MEFGGYIAKYLAPIIGETLGGAFKIVGKVAAGVIDIVGSVVGAINTVINTAIDGINFLIRAYNAIPFLGNVSELGKLSTSVSGGTPSAISGGGAGGSVSGLSGGGGLTGGGFSGGGGLSGGGGGAGGSAAPAKSLTDLVGKLTSVSDNLTELQFMVDTGAISKSAGTKQLNALVKQFDVLSKQADALTSTSTSGSGLAGLKSDSAASIVNITVNGAIDKEGTVRSVSDLFNNSYYRGTGGALNFAGLQA
jgi:hypothetical protein